MKNKFKVISAYESIGEFDLTHYVSRIYFNDREVKEISDTVHSDQVDYEIESYIEGFKDGARLADIRIEESIEYIEKDE